MKKYELKIVEDTSPESPRSWDNFTTMYCFHKRYDLGDNHNFKSDMFSGWEEFKEHIVAEFNPKIIKPLYLIDHSGISISTNDFGDVWDSGQVGWVFITEDSIKKLWGNTKMEEDRLDRIVDSEVATFDQYLRGEVYGYKVIQIETCELGHEHEEVVDSCYGFFGEEDAHEAGNEALSGYMEEVVS
jgi:hypothetical protein